MTVVLGLNHVTAPVELREKLNFPSGKLREALHWISGKTGFQELVIVSTCNRVEVYADPGRGRDMPPDARARLEEALVESRAVPREEFRDCLYYREEPESLRHLFRVAAGLDSMVVGEHEILGQVKTAYLAAHQAGTTGVRLNTLFQKALHVGKRARTQTDIGNGALSVGSVAVGLAQQIFGELRGRMVMVLGAGETAALAARHLQSQGVATILVANRTFERAQALARETGGQAVRFDEWGDYLDGTDIVIASTASPHPIFGMKEAARVMARRGHRPLFLIDIAVPRDIEESVGNLDDVFLYNIDDLEGMVRENRLAREQAVTACEELVTRELANYVNGRSPHPALSPRGARGTR